MLYVFFIEVGLVSFGDRLHPRSLFMDSFKIKFRLRSLPWKSAACLIPHTEWSFLADSETPGGSFVLGSFSRDLISLESSFMHVEWLCSFG